MGERCAEESNEAEMEDDLHPLREQIQNLEFEGDTKTAKKLREEAERTLEHQLNTLDDIDSKAMSILRINILLVGLILTAVSLAVDNELATVGQLTNPYIAIGITSLLLSTALAAFTYTASDSEVGMDYQTIREVINADLTEREFEIGAAQSYTHWIEFNNQTNIRNAPYITLTSVLIVVALANLSVGVYDAFFDGHTNAIGISTWVVLLVFTAATGLPQQLNRARKEWSVSDWWPY